MSYSFIRGIDLLSLEISSYVERFCLCTFRVKKAFIEKIFLDLRN